jgi:hypothetical protein
MFDFRDFAAFAVTNFEYCLIFRERGRFRPCATWAFARQIDCTREKIKQY